MAKKIVLIGLSLLSAVMILALSVVRTRAVAPPAATVSPQKVDYFLAYPGILPDHFLYPIKMIRDQIWLFLTTDSLQRFELLVLFGDKRLGAGKALIEGNKIDLGITTITKAEKYLERAVNQLAVIAKTKKEKEAAAKEKIIGSLRKHEEVIRELKERLPENERGRLDDSLRLNQRLQDIL